MKRKATKKDFTKFQKRNTHKRRSKEERRRALLREIEALGILIDGAKIKESQNLGGFHSPRGRGAPRQTRGVFSGARGGFGFVSTEDGYMGDVFIPEGKTLGAIDGDLVEIKYRVYLAPDGRERTEGRVEKIVKYGRETLTGILSYRESYMRGRHRVPAAFFLLPDERRIGSPIWVADTGGAIDGDKVLAKILRDPYGDTKCSVLESFGNALTREANYGSILAECGIAQEFTDEELAFAEISAAREITDDGRKRLTREVVFTIDGEGAKDLDDAVSLRRKGEVWVLGVHIADVSYYVPEKTVLDRAVMRRGTSVYFTDKVVPMLPPCLSNGACSLNAGEDKYALSAFIELDRDGEIKSLKLEKTVIQSRVRGVYSEVNLLLGGKADKSIKEKYSAVMPSLKRMAELYEVLLKKSTSRGTLELEIEEAEIILSPDGTPIRIEKRERGVSERIIEQFMLTANEAVATYLSEREIPCVYRIHDGPKEEKLRELSDYLRTIGIEVRDGELARNVSGELSRILSKAKEKGISEAVSYAMLRSMAKAVYSDKCSPHFGLGIERYCHFTSPIRRLSDLATHRIIHKTLFEGKRAAAYKSYAARAAIAATEGEERAVGAERRIENLYKAIYMSEKVGEEFESSVCSVNSFGIFVRLGNTCEGLIPISELGGMFMYDDKRLTISRGLVSYSLKDRLLVRLEEVDISDSRIRFSLIKKL